MKQSSSSRPSPHCSGGERAPESRFAPRHSTPLGAPHPRFGPAGALRARTGATWVDIGTGAGFPGRDRLPRRRTRHPGRAAAAARRFPPRAAEALGLEATVVTRARRSASGAVRRDHRPRLRAAGRFLGIWASSVHRKDFGCFPRAEARNRNWRSAARRGRVTSAWNRASPTRIAHRRRERGEGEATR